MSYQMRELHSAAWAPFLPWLQATARFLAPSGSASALSVRPFAAGFDLLVRLCQRYPKPAFGLTATTVDGQPVPVTEAVVLDKPFCRLLHFERATRQVHPAVLVVAPLSGHHATLLRETVRTMLPDFDVYLTDWRDARTVPLTAGAFHLDDYVAYLREFLGFLGPHSHVVSICQSTVPVVAAVALAAARGEPTPRSMTLMGGPIDARRSPTAVNELAFGKSLAWFERQLIDTVPGRYPGAGRKVYPGFLQHAAFVSMNPERHLASHLNYYFDLSTGDAEAAEAHCRFYDEYNAVLDMAAEYYLETVQVVFQDFRLARGTWQVDGESVRPQAIRDTVLITVEGERDDICGPGQTHAAHGLCTGLDASQRYQMTLRGCGHYGIFSGRVWRTELYPRLRQLIHQHDTDPHSHAAS
ncbi:polyhydroxyalkanoate depolymerase [Paraburkholderia sp. CNPSo 3157]|uniref:Polyhydroxyalkanoate depolymerase n=2 Tax=Paraburkholderia franconis TaxID=2654983 RepID=A0A7X1TL52_9BURK|nr:polyhydroxyalkanoate depolymerase [Paraburkholderia franconis]MPW23276.1 polyhydroxyalkanoate depolymerase [Paraburkholderia franconis]